MRKNKEKCEIWFDGHMIPCESKIQCTILHYGIPRSCAFLTHESSNQFTGSNWEHSKRNHICWTTSKNHRSSTESLVSTRSCCSSFVLGFLGRICCGRLGRWYSLGCKKGQASLCISRFSYSPTLLMINVSKFLKFNCGRFGPAGDPRGAGIGTPEAIKLVWSCHREVIYDVGPVPHQWQIPPSTWANILFVSTRLM